uniref:Uncharacterized protein n=1 Tax=Bracon brevicornis TaxID=1563983 RepID=A0A6V7L3X9_9HYME
MVSWHLMTSRDSMTLCRNSHGRCGLTSRTDRIWVSSQNTRNAPHNGSLSNGDHGSVGRGNRSGSIGYDQARRRLRLKWTKELKQDLVQCWQDSEPGAIGYMAGFRDRWCKMHPEYSHFTGQHLRNQARRLVRQGYDLLLVQHSPDSRRSLGSNQAFEGLDLNQACQQEGVPPPASMRELRIRVNKVTGQFFPGAEDLARENDEMALSLPDDVDLLGLDWAVYGAAVRLKPRTVAKSTVEARARRRIKQLQAKIELARKQASRIQSVVDFVTSGREFTIRIRRIAEELRYQHHTRNKAILLVIKERFVGRIRVLGTIKKSLDRKLRRLIDNRVFQTDPKRWFQPPAPVSGEGPSVGRVEEFRRGGGVVRAAAPS